MIRKLAVLAVAASASGCATVGDFVSQSHKANLAIEQTQNNTVLLNAIRASERRPMHFTSLSTLKGPIGDGATSLTLGLPAFGPDRGGKNLWTPALSYKPDSPSFDVTVWDSQAFMRGITMPLDPKTFVYYLDQGWPMQLMLALLVREIRVVDGEGNVKDHFVNYPENRDQYDEFQAKALTLSHCHFGFRKSKDVVAYGPVFTPQQIGDLKAIAKIKEQGLLLTPLTREDKQPDGSLVKVITGYQVVKEDESQVMRLEDLPKTPKGSCRPFGIAAGPFLMTSSANLDSTIRMLGADPKSGDKKATTVIALTIRSPEAALYHLGELARVQLTGAYRIQQDGTQTKRKPFTPEVDLGAPGRQAMEKLFVVNTAPIPEGVKPPAVARYDDVTYWISPDPEKAGRSMRMITLVEQLINLQKDGKDLPVTTTIRISQ
jgi:hypothetical protein